MWRRSLIILPAFLVVFLASCNPVNDLTRSENVLRWESDIEVFDSLNAVEYSDENTLLVAGSSSVRLWDQIHEDLAPYDIMKRGYGGAKLTDFNHYVQRIIKPQPFKAILIFVANDISGGEHDKSPREVFRLYKSIIKKIRTTNPDTPLFWIEVTPTPSRRKVIGEIRQAGDLIRHYCNKSPGLYFIDTYEVFMNKNREPDPGFFMEDMLHLNRKGYAVWSETILKALDQSGINP